MLMLLMLLLLMLLLLMLLQMLRQTRLKIVVQNAHDTAAMHDFTTRLTVFQCRSHI
jgi:hypothetical protein